MPSPFRRTNNSVEYSFAGALVASLVLFALVLAIGISAWFLCMAVLVGVGIYAACKLFSDEDRVFVDRGRPTVVVENPYCRRLRYVPVPTAPVRYHEEYCHGHQDFFAPRAAAQVEQPPHGPGQAGVVHHRE